MNILSLGAGGFIGAHLTKRLLDDGHSVTALDIHSDKIKDLLGRPGLIFLQRDIRQTGMELDDMVQAADLVVVKRAS